ncbi:MAG: hypothetical protein WBQ45_03410 [Roseiarcus sp.]
MRTDISSGSMFLLITITLAAYVARSIHLAPLSLHGRTELAGLAGRSP